MLILDSFVKNCNSVLIGKDNDDISNVMDYLQFRGLTEESVKLYNIGYCPVDMAIPDEISHFGSEFREFEVGEDRRDLSFFLSGRLIIPVYDEFDECVGLATRKPTFKKGETWWNLPTPFYKGKHLYLLNKARRSMIEKNKVYLVEGYMDALYLRQEKLQNTCGIMGTALTLRKIGLLSRYCSNICICFDVDKNNAGQEAAHKAICQLHRLNFCDSISIINTLPVGVDPDEYVRKNGLDSFLAHEKILNDNDIREICEEVAKSIKRKKEDAREKFHKNE